MEFHCGHVFVIAKNNPIFISRISRNNIFRDVHLIPNVSFQELQYRILADGFRLPSKSFHGSGSHSCGIEFEIGNILKPCAWF